MSAVTFDRITKKFDDATAVDELSIEVADGEFLVLLGPSGCGKSTALRMLAGLETPTSGTISIGDEEVTNVDPRKRDVAMVFQSYALYPHMSVAKNIESPLVGRSEISLDKAERKAKVAEAAGLLGLTEYLNRKPAQLSGGQRQRVALARAIVREPAVFCMDEPLSNLDAKLRTQTRAELVALHDQLATTFVYVTHDQVEAMTMATRIAVLNEGRLQQIGTPREIYDTPANLFVAQFIGSPAMNTFGATIQRTDADGANHAWARIGENTLYLGPATGALDEGQEVHVGVRPEHLTAGSEGIEVEVTNEEWLGHERIVLAKSTADGSAIAIRETAGQPGSGDRVRHYGADASHIHVFAGDGERVGAR